MCLSKFIELCTPKRLNSSVLNYTLINITRQKPDQKPEQSKPENNTQFNMSILSMTLGATIKQSDAYICVVCYKCSGTGVMY